MEMPNMDDGTWARVSPLLDVALDLPAEGREAWLAALTVTHPDVAPVVRGLLAERDALDAKGFLAQSPFPVPGSLAGTVAGAYTLERPLGRGGMGEVWLARRNDGRFDGLCAVKFLDDSVAHPKLAERFRREGNLLARLTHPHIARLLDAGAANGRAYLALEYVDGEGIDSFCARLPVDARVRLFVDVVAAVAHAHSHLIVHRDLKPSNVLVTRDGQVKLLDFGIAKLLSADPGDGELTRVEDAALTPEYAAPEQMLGELPSTATDVYQLGMLLYVLLTGRHPVPASGTRAEKVRMALAGVIPRASELADESTRQFLRGDLDAILDKALRRDPAERYATAQ
ncbi:MAG: serine/threonine-protein kinase, partial [Pseudomonadota bacterium]